MNAGTKIGGPVANPIREMLRSKHHDGVVFDCQSPEKAQSTRCAAMMLKIRNNYNYKTMRRDNRLTVYKSDVDPFEMHGVIKVNLNREDYRK